jgi:hypothetical protein
MGRAARRERRDHPAHRQLTLDEELELLVGRGRVPGEPGLVSDFDSDEERHQAWLAHEDDIRAACPEPWAAEHYR